MQIVTLAEIFVNICRSEFTIDFFSRYCEIRCILLSLSFVSLSFYLIFYHKGIVFSQWNNRILVFEVAY